MTGIAAVVSTCGFAAANATAEPPPPGNLVANPSFERQLTPEWIGFRSSVSRVELPPGEAPDGASVAQVVGGALADTVEGYSIDDVTSSGGTSVPAGTQFVASAFMRAAAPQSLGKLGKVWIRERKGGALIGAVNGEVPLTGAFEKVTAPLYTSQVAGSHVDVYVAQNPAAPGDAFQADLVTMARNLPPDGEIGVSVENPAPGGVVAFSAARVTDPEGVGVASRAWDLDGDGNFAEGDGLTASRRFDNAGTYTVRLRVADSNGATAVLSRRIVVSSARVSGGPAGPGAGPGASRRGRFTLSARQLLINQRIGQAAIRRLNAVEAKLDGRTPTTGRRSGSRGRVTLSARQLLINQRIYQAGVRRANALEARLDGRPAPRSTGAGAGGIVRLSVIQLMINQRIAQAAVRRANALRERVG